MRALTLSLILLALAACERDGHYERPLNPGQARVLDTHLAWVLPEQREVVLVDPSAPHARRVALAGEARATQVAPDGRGWLVLDFDGATWIPLNGPVRRIPLGGSYQRVAFAPDGARAVLYAEQGAGATLSNPNQIAVLDLEAGTATERTLRSYGSAPQQVVVAPDTAGRPLAWLLAERYLALIDLSLPAAREVVVHLVLAADPREVTPAQVAFGEVDGVPVTFVRALGSDDLFSLTFPEAPAAGEVPRPYLNQLPGAAGAADLWVGTVAEGPRLFSCGRGTLAITHPVTGRRVVVEVGFPATRILPFRAPRPEDPETEGQFALIWSIESPTVVFADLDLVERRGGRALTPLTLPVPITALEPLPGRRGAVARLGETGLALLDFDGQTATPLTASERMTGLVVEPSGDHVHALVEQGNGASVVTIDTATGATVDVPIPGGVGLLLYVPGVDRVVVDHGASWGRISVVAGAQVTEYEGFFLEGVLE